MDNKIKEVRQGEDKENILNKKTTFKKLFYLIFFQVNTFITRHRKWLQTDIGTKKNKYINKFCLKKKVLAIKYLKRVVCW